MWVRVIAARKRSRCSRRSKSPTRCLGSGANTEGPKGITGASWWRTSLIDVLVLDDVLPNRGGKRRFWVLCSETDLFTFPFLLLLLILSATRSPLTASLWWKPPPHWWRRGDKLIDQAGGYWSNWSSAVTLDLPIDSSPYNEASEQRPWDRGFWEGHLWGGMGVGGNPRGWVHTHTHTHTHTDTHVHSGPAQSTWCHCYIAVPSITPICIIGFRIVWPRHIKVPHCIVDSESARAHCLLIST